MPHVNFYQAALAMRVDEFDFDLPKELIAERPVSPRDSAKLLHVCPDRIEDRIVRELPELLQPGDLMIFNDTRVIPARLFGKRGEARIETMLHEQIALDSWKAFARPAKKLRPGDQVDYGQDFTAEVIAKGEGGEVTLRFNHQGPALMAALERHGELPLPPYIKREAGPDERDRQDYQTIFARHEGAVAAPTAGLHFTPELLDALKLRGVEMAAVTLHVGAGTFLPVKTDIVEEHKMHSERGSISAETAARINATRQAGGRIVAIGTTSLRLLEAAAQEDGTMPEFHGATDIFITPGYRFKCVDLLMTNFHLPRSTLFMLVSAFAGTGRMKRAYDHAIEHGYRFYSYGDSSLLHRSTD